MTTSARPSLVFTSAWIETDEGEDQVKNGLVIFFILNVKVVINACEEGAQRGKKSFKVICFERLDHPVQVAGCENPGNGAEPVDQVLQE